MTDTPSRRRISEAALLVRNAGYPDVSKWMMARDKKQSHTKRPPKARRVDVANRFGGKARGGSKGFVPQELIEQALKQEGK